MRGRIPSAFNPSNKWICPAAFTEKVLTGFFHEAGTKVSAAR
jgi:hypothetical protein